LRDQGPRGLRFMVNASSQAAQVVYTEQPDPYTGGTVSVPSPPGNLATFTGVDFIGGADAAHTSPYLVQPGDYFPYLTHQSNYPILSVTGATTLTLRNPVPAPPGPINASAQYQIIRQTRAISGETPVDLPQNVVVDLAQVPATNQVPNGQFPTGAYYEILFDPGGGVMHRGGSPRIVLVVGDAPADDPLEANTTRVLAINPRTGLISAHPVGPPGNPLQYALDGKSSGM